MYRENCRVTANVKTVRKDQTECHAVQVAASDSPSKITTNAMRDHFRKAGVLAKYNVKEFPVTPDIHIPAGACPTPLAFALRVLMRGYRYDILLFTLRVGSVCRCRRELVRLLPSMSFSSDLKHAFSIGKDFQ